MAKVTVKSGICGFTATVRTAMDGDHCAVEIDSDCEHIRELGGTLTEVSPYQEISYRGLGPRTLALAAQILPHPACPVPAGTVKAIEVASGLALPADATITVEKD